MSRYGSGRYEHVFETTTAGVTIQSPQLDINTVAAGGGSRLFFRNGLFVVGPEVRVPCRSLKHAMLTFDRVLAPTPDQRVTARVGQQLSLMPIYT